MRSLTLLAIVLAVALAAAAPAAVAQSPVPPCLDEWTKPPKLSGLTLTPGRVPVTPSGDIVARDVTLRVTVSQGGVDNATIWLYVFDQWGRMVGRGSVGQWGPGIFCGQHEWFVGTVFDERASWETGALGRPGSFRPNRRYLLVATAYGRETSGRAAWPAWRAKWFTTVPAAAGT
ncbi:hypothetical protein LRS13_09775 [Svornostia abyssi]|uniref:Uncharacterized protein n=1 Tax=Svornostia abyssi TaxID=2898438 RepID=A0ABY5PMD2_9ACTN|nr:hypothetical protein LRS13_09775 [Parviterribacteraceae bacterium J379]